MENEKMMFELFQYDKNSGQIFWRKSRPGATAGKEAGSITAQGYRQICTGGRAYQSHRIAVLLVTGKWPEGEVDHLNGNRSDNRWENLRVVSRTQNMRNKSFRTVTKSGHAGIYRQNNKWRVKVGAGAGQIHIGYFDKIEDAIAARLAAEKALNYSSRHGSKVVTEARK